MEGNNDKREAEEIRKTKETEIKVRVCLGSQQTSIETGIGFFDHMLSSMGFHGSLGLEVRASGDTNVDHHHLVEDVGIVFGKAIRKAIGPDPFIIRFASVVIPMDEALSLVALDVSGRGGAFVDEKVGSGWVLDFDASLVEEFLKAFASAAGITLHVHLLSGKNIHHIIESVFKGLGFSLKRALLPSGNGVPSTKGTLEH